MIAAIGAPRCKHGTTTHERLDWITSCTLADVRVQVHGMRRDTRALHGMG